MRSWLCALTLLVAFTGGVFAIGHGTAASSRTTIASSPIGTATAAVPAWCQSDHEPKLPALDHEMPNGMRMDMVMPAVTGAACTELVQQLTVASRIVRAFPTLASALHAGYHPVGFYGPGVGLHMERPQGVGSYFDPAQPTYLLYDGMAPGARLAGLAYQLDDRTGVPEFFVGLHDMPHSHAYCPRRAGWTADREPGEPGCTRDNAVEGHRWMIHVWVIPGRPSPWGVFSSVNPALTMHGWDAAQPLTPHQLDCAYSPKGTPGCAPIGSTVDATTSGLQ